MHSHARRRLSPPLPWLGPLPPSLSLLRPGTHAFHNYTRRRLYRQGEGVRPQRKGRRGRRAAEAEESDDEDEAAASSFDEEEAPAGSAGSSAPSSSGNGSSGSSGGGGGGGSGAEGAAGAEAGRGKGFVRLTWKHEKDPADLIGRRHYRWALPCALSRSLEPRRGRRLRSSHQPSQRAALGVAMAWPKPAAPPLHPPSKPILTGTSSGAGWSPT